MTIRTIQVMIADDHPIVVEGLLAVFNQSVHCQVVGVAHSFRAVVDLLAAQPVDVIVLDLGGMGGAPLPLLSRVRREYPQVQIVIFSSSVDLAPELLSSGACGYVIKEDLAGQIVAAVQAAYAKQQFLSPVVEEYIERSQSGRQQHQLSPKEQHVLKLLTQGYGTEAIAEQMGIDPRTVQNYITRARRETGCTERVQLVDWYRRMYGNDDLDT